MHVPGQRPESEAVLVAALGALGDSPPRAVSEACLPMWTGLRLGLGT